MSPKDRRLTDEERRRRLALLDTLREAEELRARLRPRASQLSRARALLRARTTRGQADHAGVGEPHALPGHAQSGSGVVTRYEGDRIVVLFEDVGHRTLSLEAVAARGLLERA